MMYVIRIRLYGCTTVLPGAFVWSISVGVISCCARPFLRRFGDSSIGGTAIHSRFGWAHPSCICLCENCLSDAKRCTHARMHTDITLPLSCVRVCTGDGAQCEQPQQPEREGQDAADGEGGARPRADPQTGHEQVRKRQGVRTPAQGARQGVIRNRCCEILTGDHG